MTNRITIPFLFFATLAFTGCSTNDTNRQQGIFADSAVNITTATGLQGATGNVILATGQVEAVQTANISTRIMGYITSVHVKVGDIVRQGQLLFTVNSSDIQAKQAQTDAAIMQAEAALTNAQKDYDRFTALYKQQSATDKELDNVTQQYNTAKAAVEAAKQLKNEVAAQIRYTNVVAPFAGVVTQKLLDAGNLATPGIPVLTIQQGNSLQVTATIPETEITGVKNGEQVVVAVAAAGKTITGKIVQVSPSAQFTSGQYIVKVYLPLEAQQGLYAGMYATVTVAGQPTSANYSPSAILVPLSALIHKDDLDGLYTVSNDKHALLRWIRLGKATGDKVEVLSGLDRGEKFITSSSGRLYNGVRVIEK